MPQQGEDILRYLEQKMPLHERIAFEQKMNEDEALAQEVTFQRGLYAFFDKRHPKLEANLDSLGDEFVLNTPSNSYKYIWLGILAVFVLGISTYFIFFYNTSEPINSTPPPATNQTIKPSIQPNLDKTEEEQTPTIEETIPSNTPSPIEIAPLKRDSQQFKNDRPIAAVDRTAFEPNPVLESILRDAYRNSTLKDTVRLLTPTNNAVFKTAPILFTVEGTSNTASSNQLIIYSNRTFDIENDYRLLSVPLKAIEKNEIYNFNFSAYLDLPKGLYYMMIRKENSRDILYISRFKVE